MKKYIAFGCVILLAIFLAKEANASPLYYEFEGTIKYLWWDGAKIIEDTGN